MRKLLLSVFLCFAMVMGLLPTATFALELGNAPWSVEKAPTSAWKGQTAKERNRYLNMENRKMRRG